MMGVMNLESLHSMATDSLLEFAKRMGLDLPDGLERPFIIEEILDAREEERYGAVEGSLSTLSGLDSLPAVNPEGQADAEQGTEKGLCDIRYNESSIQAVLKDPSWAYLSWDLREDENAFQHEQDGKGFSIRVIELASPQDPPKNALSWFDFAISPQDGEWYVNLPEDGMSYAFELSSGTNKDRKVLARSNIVQTPKLRRLEDFEKLPKVTKSLLELSGFRNYLPERETVAKGSRILPMAEE